MKTTPLHKSHLSAGAKMGAFAGYDMPLYYADGVMKEHEWTRAHAGLFDVSHMGQVILEGPGAAAFWGRLTPTSFENVAPGRAKYTVLTNEQGGIVDDLIITRLGAERFFAVINAGCKDKDIAWIKDHLPQDVKFSHLEDRALIALQGPQAEGVLRAALKIDASAQPYMWLEPAKLPDGTEIFVSRLGYTGEDGFELSVPAQKAEGVWAALMENSSVRPVGLAARDSLRLDMGYPLYGHDIDDTTSPVEAGLSWVMTKGHSGYNGHAVIAKQLENGVTRQRVGIKLTDKGIAREGSVIRSNGAEIGKLTSGGFSPTLKAAIGMGYVDAESVGSDKTLSVLVRDRDIAAEVCAFPFMAAKTKSMKKQAA